MSNDKWKIRTTETLRFAFLFKPFDSALEFFQQTFSLAAGAIFEHGGFAGLERELLEADALFILKPFVAFAQFVCQRSESGINLIPLRLSRAAPCLNHGSQLTLLRG